MYLRQIRKEAGGVREAIIKIAMEMGIINNESDTPVNANLLQKCAQKLLWDLPGHLVWTMRSIMPTCYFWHRGLSGGMEDEGKATFCRKFHNTRHLSEVPEETRDRYDVIFFNKCIQTPEDGDVEALVHLLTVGTV